MKLFFTISLALLATCCAETYTSENDNFDMETFVADKENLRSMVNCFLGKAECDKIPAAFKKDLGDAIEHACSKCTDAQKHLIRVFLEALKKLPEEDKAFRNKYDPQNKYFAPLQEVIAKY